VNDDDLAGPSIALGGSSGSENHGLTQLFTWNVVDGSSLGPVSVQVTKNGTSIFGGSTSTGSFNFDAFGLGTYILHVAATDADNDWLGDESSNSYGERRCLFAGEL
jgi:hypothetical protein